MNSPPTPPPAQLAELEPAPPIVNCSYCFKEHKHVGYLVCPTNAEHRVSCCRSCVETGPVFCPFCAAASKVAASVGAGVQENNAVGSVEKVEDVDAPRYCPNAGCHHWGKISEHAASCVYRTITCEAKGCGATFPAVHSTAHSVECTATLLTCIRGGRGCPPFTRAEAEEHDRVCAHYTCRVTPGCQTRCTQPLLLYHETTCGAMFRSWQSLGAQVEQANAENGRLQKENLALQRDKKMLKDTMAAWWLTAVRGSMSRQG